MSPLAPLTPLQEILLAAVKVLVFIGVLQGVFSGMTYIERRLLAFMQYRLGPNRTGPFGLLQPVADGIKLFFKEEFIPYGAGRFFFSFRSSSRLFLSAFPSAAAERCE